MNVYFDLWMLRTKWLDVRSWIRGPKISSVTLLV